MLFMTAVLCTAATNLWLIIQSEEFHFTQTERLGVRHLSPLTVLPLSLVSSSSSLMPDRDDDSKSAAYMHMSTQ